MFCGMHISSPRQRKPSSASGVEVGLVDAARCAWSRPVSGASWPFGRERGLVAVVDEDDVGGRAGRQVRAQPLAVVTLARRPG